MTEKPRVRFAPSPTGFLHIGGARTALFNWLYARANGGQFLLRIEDTDRERSESRFTDDILESLRWMGMQWDEPPLFQSERFPRYTALVNELIAKGSAYRCDCTTQTLDAIRALCEKEKRPFRYPGTCRDKKEVKSPAVVRVKVPRSGETGFTDQIRGPITFQNKDIDDWVVLRADGSPTYNFSVVVDDHDQKITHILRGDDHINNTPKQILLYQTFGYPVPLFAHLPMIMGADRAKLSKRHGAASTLEYRGMGYLPITMINFLVRMGWSHGDQEIFTVEELFKFFALDKIGKANAIFSPDKLNWTSGILMRDTPAKEIAAYVKKYFAPQLAFASGVSEDTFERGVAIVQGKVKTMLELVAQLSCLFGPDPSYATETVKADDRPRMREALTAAEPLLQEADFSATSLQTRIKEEADKRQWKVSVFAQALRFAVTGGRISPGLYEMLEIQGQETVLRRVKHAQSALA